MSDIEENIIEVKRESLWSLFYVFFKIGAFTFGGGFAMIPLIEKQVVDKRNWVEREQFLETLVLAQSAPGPVSLNVAVFVGYNLRGLAGALAALSGVVVPSFVIMLLVAMFFRDIRDNKVIESIFKALRPAVVALIAAPVFSFAKSLNIYGITIALAVGVGLWVTGISPIYILLLGAAGGIVWRLIEGRENK